MAEKAPLFLDPSNPRWNKTFKFTNVRRVVITPLPERDRSSHSGHLRAQLDSARQDAEQQKQAAAVPAKDGHYLEFESAPGYALATERLEDLRAGIRLLNVSTSGEGKSEVTRATVYIPEGKAGHFLKKIKDYANEEKDNDKGTPKNQSLVASISNIRLALVKSFWKDDESVMPDDDNPKWCEVWLHDDDASTTQEFSRSFEEIGVASGTGRLKFPERTVMLVKASKKQLEKIIVHNADIAEFRLAKETARFFLEELSPPEEAEWADDLLSRVKVSANPRVAITILDTGANRGHMLLENSLAEEDCHAVEEDWETNDHHPRGHGTLMCGLALYGNLQKVLENNKKISLEHCLESVKILPPPPDKNDPDLYGDITVQGISLAAIESPEKQRIACMAVTANDSRDKGRPSSWSAAIDKFTSGYTDDKQRLFFVAAGNVDWDNSKSYPDNNLNSPVQDPGQSWNALTVGAFTKKTDIRDPSLAGFTPVAQAGELSPFSSTSSKWKHTKWPVKPDIVLEGGNLAQEKNDLSFSECADLSLLSTSHEPTERQFDSMNATSAATAYAAWMAAQIQSAYPDAWPETVRALLVHSAEWTEEMEKQFLKKKNKTNYANLLHACGYGVPKLDRALACYENRLTLVAEKEIQPFKKDGGDYVTNEMHLHTLPWPKQELIDLGAVPVVLRITLSYFIEPGPGERGWRDRYRYASHALRFDLNNVGETEEKFRIRINGADREDGERPETDSGSGRWKIGSGGRSLGSVHSDIWEGPAAQLATCNLIGVHPVIGWWRERRREGRFNRKARYSLIVSLKTDATNVDIYTPVKLEIDTPITIE